MSVLDLNLLEQLRQLSAAGNPPALPEQVKELQPYDLSLLIQELDFQEQLFLWSLLPPAVAAETLKHFEPDQQYRFLDHLGQENMARILNEMSSDEVVQLFTAIHPRRAEQLFQRLEKPFQEQIRNLMSYPENTAGSLVSVDYIAIRQSWTVEETLRHVRKVGHDAEIYNYLYVLEATGELVGVLSLRELIMAPPATPVTELLNRKVISVPAGLDQEQAARLLAQYDLVALPVVSEDGKMVGVITVDDVLDIIQEEATEDIHRLGGSQPLESPYLHAGFWALFRKRIGWLALLFVAGALTSNILHHYEHMLTSMVALSFFIPLLIGTGGNAGAQTSTLVIRAMAMGEISAKDTLKVIWREMRLGVVLGLAMAVITFIWAETLGGDSSLGLTVSATVIAVVAFSSSTGALMPIIGKRLGLDPAVFSAPMITSLVDACGLLIYFQFARLMLGLY